MYDELLRKCCVKVSIIMDVSDNDFEKCPCGLHLMILQYYSIIVLTEHVVGMNTLYLSLVRDVDWFYQTLPRTPHTTQGFPHVDVVVYSTPLGYEHTFRHLQCCWSV